MPKLIKACVGVTSSGQGSCFQRNKCGRAFVAAGVAFVFLPARDVRGRSTPPCARRVPAAPRRWRTEVAGEPEVPSALFTTHHVRVQNGRAAIAKADCRTSPPTSRRRRWQRCPWRARTFCVFVWNMERSWAWGTRSSRSRCSLRRARCSCPAIRARPALYRTDHGSMDMDPGSVSLPNPKSSWIGGLPRAAQNIVWGREVESDLI